MIHRINVFLLSVIIAFAPAYLYAAGDPWDYDYKKAGRWAAKFQNIIGESEYYKILEARGEKDIIQSGTKKTVSATARVSVGASEVGGVMAKRIAQSVAGGGVALLGVAAVQTLLEGIGWVMEEGVYVKKKVEEGDPPPNQYQYLYSFQKPTSQWYDTAGEAARTVSTRSTTTVKYIFKSVVDKGNLNYAVKYDVEYYNDNNQLTNKQIDVVENLQRRVNPNPNPVSNTTIQITDEQIGCAIFGTCYHDPVDPSIDAGVNNGVGHPDIIKNAATPDENAGENDQTNPITKKVNDGLDAAPKTTEKEGTDGKTESTTEQTTDEEGNPVTKTTGDFKLPAFCDWAAYMCDWIDWTKDDDLPEKDNTDFDDESPVVQKDVDVNFGSECPAPASVSYTVKGRTESIQVVNFEYVCAQAPIIKPAIIALASIGAAFIVFGRGREQ